MRYTTLALMLATLSVTLQAQIFETIDSTSNSVIRAYHSNNGVSFFGDNNSFVNGLEWPRGSGRGYLTGAGVWVGARKKDTLFDRIKCVSMSYAVQHRSMCTPGERKNGNQFREDLSELYKPKKSVDLNSETLSSSFHDGDLRVYQYDLGETIADSNTTWKQVGLPLGLQYNQKFRYWVSGPLENSVFIETTVINASTDTLFDVVLGTVSDIAVGGVDYIDQNQNPETSDRCSLLDSGTNHPIVVGFNDEPNDTLYNKGCIATALVKTPRIDSTTTIHIHNDNFRVFGSWIGQYAYYDLMNRGIYGDSLPPGDKIVLLGAAIGNLIPGDSVTFSYAYVLANRDGTEAEVIRTSLQALRELPTSVNENSQQTQHPHSAQYIGNGSSVYIPEVVQQTAMNFTVYNLHGERVSFGTTVELTTVVLQLPVGYYSIHLLTNQQPPFIVSVVKGE